MIKITDVWTDTFTEFVDDIVNNIQHVTLVILDCLHEVNYYDMVFNKEQIDKLLNITQQHNVPIKILTANSNKNPALDKFSNIEIIVWNTFWFVRTFRNWTWDDAYKYNTKKGVDIKQFGACKHFELTIPYVCLNNVVKKHRCALMDMLAKHDLIKQGAVTWRGVVNGGVECDYPFKHWTPEQLLLDQGLDVRFNQETMPNEFNHSFMQLVTESDDTDVFFSEKTATPMLLNKPFLVATCAGFHKELKKQGFELYDELFDYSFDDEPDMHIRYDKLVENIKPYIGLNQTQLKEQYNKVADKITHNRNLAFYYAMNVPTEIIKLHMLIDKNVPSYSGPLNNIKYIYIG
jgi:hypothetical protein